jgi:hypothetical protein
MTICPLYSERHALEISTRKEQMVSQCENARPHLNPKRSTMSKERGRQGPRRWCPEGQDGDDEEVQRKPDAVPDVRIVRTRLDAPNSNGKDADADVKAAGLNGKRYWRLN